MLRRTLIALPVLALAASSLGACGSFTRNCQKETRYESDYVYEEPRREVNVNYDTTPTQTVIQRRSPCQR